MRDSELVVVGHLGGVYGVRGWVRVHSETEPEDNILHYKPWHVRCGDQWQVERVAEGQRRGKAIVARLAGCEDRDEARRFAGADIAVLRSQLPTAGEGEVYWTDLLGLQVETANGVVLGRVKRMMATGANDVVVVEGERERLIPFLPGDVILDIDRSRGVLRVDWDPEF